MSIEGRLSALDPGLAYNVRSHITRDELGQRFGLPRKRITELMQREGGPTPLGIIEMRDPQTRVKSEMRYYKRKDAIAWMQKQCHGEGADKPKNPVPPSDISRMKRKNYGPSPELSIAQARADAAYEGRGFVPMGGVGNGEERKHGFGRGA